MANQNSEPVEYRPNKYLYKTWKIILQPNNLWQAMRVHPAYFFTALTLQSAARRIDSLESQYEKSGEYPSHSEKKQKLMSYLKSKKERNVGSID